MELLVLRQFRDKFNPSKLYKEEDIISFEDKARCQDLIKRGLCKAVEIPFEECEIGGAEATETKEVATPQEPANEPEKKPAPAKKKNTKK